MEVPEKFNNNNNNQLALSWKFTNQINSDHNWMKFVLICENINNEYYYGILSEFFLQEDDLILDDFQYIYFTNNTKLYNLLINNNISLVDKTIK